MEIQFLGGADEVGRMCILVDGGRDKFILDYGLEVQEMLPPIEPYERRDRYWIEKISGIIISHGHLDHCGLIPSLYKRGYNGKCYMTSTTRALSSLLLYDSIKVQDRKGLQPSFMAQDIERMERRTVDMDFRKPIQIGSSTLTLYDAGHIPGSSMILLEMQGKRVLFTGDTKFQDTYLMGAADTEPIKDIDALMIESTYSYKDHPKREELAQELRKKVKKVLDAGGIVLIPSFAVGRTQEMLLILHDLGYPVFLDGMGIDSTHIVLTYPKYIKDPKRLQKAFSVAHKIERSGQRNQAVKGPCIVITTSGMLNGGPINFYVKKLHKREDCMMILNGYQVEDTVGRKLLDTGRYVNDGIDVKPKMAVEFMDFSAHAGRSGLINFIRKVRPKKVFCVHGAHTEEFAEELRKMGLDAYAPTVGETLTI